jgi:hypothetical protein
MKITVEQRDISLANKRRQDRISFSITSSCPVALAMKRISKKKWQVGMTVATQGKRSVSLPGIASNNMAKWDAGKRMYPFTFEI